MALIAADQWMPQMTGIELLEQARVHAPGGQLLLLTAYADTDARMDVPDPWAGGFASGTSRVCISQPAEE